MSKQKGVLRYTDKATGKPVVDVPKDMLGAHLGLSRSRTAKRAESRYMNNVNGAGKGDMTRRGTEQTKYREGYDRIDWSE